MYTNLSLILLWPQLLYYLGDMSQKPAAAALKLGVSEQDLKDALGIP